MTSGDPDVLAEAGKGFPATCPVTRYVIITPVRDEQEYITRTLQAVTAQTITPSCWIIVNDGSSDNTGTIAESYTRQYSWVQVVHRANRGRRKNGAGVVETFQEGYRYLEGIAWDYIVKLDGDISFSPDYFEKCFIEFERDPSLGIGGGRLYDFASNGAKADSHPFFHVRGATKIYRKACWDEIGGIWPGPGWDTIDELCANRCGWSTRTFSNIEALHHRKTGAAEGGWRDNFKNGRGSYATGYHPLFVLVRCARRLGRRPYVIGALGLLCGFVSGYWRRAARLEDAQLIRYVREQQLNCLLLRPTIWK